MLGPAGGSVGAEIDAAADHRRGPRLRPEAQVAIRSWPAGILVLGVLTAAGFALRFSAINESLFGDELYTHAIVTQNGLRGVWHEVYTTSITPPLHYFLAWLAVQLPGDSTELARLPSLILGTALIPLVFALGRRIRGTRAGLLAAAIMALSPFAIFYSTEARTYETMAFLVALSTFALLNATDGGRVRWWILFAGASCGALWAHYTAAFVLIAQSLWAAWAQPAHRRALLAASAAALVGYLPWLPGYLEQRENPGVAFFDSLLKVRVDYVFLYPLRNIVARPFVELTAVPGLAGLALGLVLVGLLGVALAHRPTAPRLSVLPRSETGLVVLLAAATPIGLLLYDLVGPTLFAERALMASQPALVLLVALALDRLTKGIPALVAVAGLATVGLLLGLSAVQSVNDDYRRPPYRDVARYLDDVAKKSPIVELPFPLSPDERLHRSTLQLYLQRPHPLYRGNESDQSVWEAEHRGATVYTVAPDQRPFLEAVGMRDLPADVEARMNVIGGPDGRALVRQTRRFAGAYPLVVRRYSGVVTGRLAGRPEREIIYWSLGGRVTVRRGAATGEVNSLSPSNAPLQIGGWAADPRRRARVDWFLLFLHGRLLAVSPGGVESKEASARYGDELRQAGFALIIRSRPFDHAAIRAFAVVGRQASELPLTPAARRSAQDANGGSRRGFDGGRRLTGASAGFERLGARQPVG